MVPNSALSLGNAVVLVFANVEIDALAMKVATAILSKPKPQVSKSRLIKLWERFRLFLINLMLEVSQKLS